MRPFFIPATLAAVLSVGTFALQPAEARGTDWQGGGGGQAVQPMDQQTAMVTVNEREVMQIAAVGGMSAEERAQIIRDRLRQALEPRGQAFQPISRNDITVRQQNNMTVIRLRNQDLVTVTHKDAQAVGMSSPQTAAQRWVNDLRAALSDVQLGAGERLPENFVTVRVGGGAGTTPQQQRDRQQMDQQHMDQHPMPGGGGGGMMDDSDMMDEPATDGTGW